MYNNIGGKIKGLTKIFAVLGIIISVFLGVFIGYGLANAGDNTVSTGVVVGAIIIIVGSVLSWIGSWLLYGYGELIENTSKMAGTFSSTGYSGSVAKAVEKISCPKCGYKHDSDASSCPRCGYRSTPLPVRK